MPEETQSKKYQEIEQARLQKQRAADFERDYYLQKLRQKNERREAVRELTEKATQLRAEHAQYVSKTYLNRIARQSEFRSEVKKSFLETHKFHEEALRVLGQQYREKLIYMVGRTLDATSVPKMPARKPIDLDSRVAVENRAQETK
ncbi:MAG TPA: hypothetical protein V6C81_14990 [Planktothrix sp.]